MGGDVAAEGLSTAGVILSGVGTALNIVGGVLGTIMILNNTHGEWDYQKQVSLINYIDESGGYGGVGMGFAAMLGTPGTDISESRKLRIKEDIKQKVIRSQEEVVKAYLNQAVYFKNHDKWWDGQITAVQFDLEEGSSGHYVPVFTVDYKLNRGEVVQSVTADVLRIFLKSDGLPISYVSGYNIDDHIRDFSDSATFSLDGTLEDKTTLPLDNWGEPKYDITYTDGTSAEPKSFEIDTIIKNIEKFGDAAAKQNTTIFEQYYDPSDLPWGEGEDPNKYVPDMLGRAIASEIGVLAGTSATGIAIGGITQTTKYERAMYAIQEAYGKIGIDAVTTGLDVLYAQYLANPATVSWGEYEVLINSLTFGDERRTGGSSDPLSNKLSDEEIAAEDRARKGILEKIPPKLVPIVGDTGVKTEIHVISPDNITEIPEESLPLVGFSGPSVYNKSINRQIKLACGTSAILLLISSL
jgi:hypothetical protein